ncbi:hypothetical protein SNE40_018358 [Patella caerulea]|uniref:Reverse transcriptase RNase H-like domain-containing protein n=1 Tax=Patella caerulea TaxID=87958 RepID=A0AAN8JAJ9_PATCE
MTKEFILTTDASGDAIGYILGQKGDMGKERVIYYGGRSLSKFEAKWSISELECLAIIAGIRAFKVYLSKFTVITDHKALTPLKDIKSTGRLARWSLEIRGYNYDIIHRPGKKNCNADALSRRVYPENTTTDDECQIPSIQAVTKQNEELTEVTFCAETTNSTPFVGQVTGIQPEDNLPEIAAKQRKCPDFKHIIEFLGNKTVPGSFTTEEAKGLVSMADQYDMKDGVLYHFFQPRRRKPTSTYLQISQHYQERTEFQHFRLTMMSWQEVVTKVGKLHANL